METEKRFENKEQEHFLSRRIVIKIGTSTITGRKDRPDLDFMDDVARQTAKLLADGVDVAIVSSGAAGSGKKEGFERKDLIDRQVDAVFGQPRLISTWTNVFIKNGVEDVGQILYTDINLKERPHLAREVLTRAFLRGVVIINCNDAVADEEMQKVERSSDNDKLASDVAKLIDADTLLILTDTDGVLDENGFTLPYVDRLEDVYDLIKTSGSGTGGPRSKWQEAKANAKEGRRSIIVNGRGEDTILKVARGQNIGTRFLQGFTTY